ncbi:L,D-transpeptidase family protein [Clostridium sp.]|uniref:L,D-transpeptidase family protein n=1 Tax=Clostridium sp. TaxID=1506 RepID=UPI003D6D8A48
MRKKNIIIGALLAVGVISAYEIYKSNFKNTDFNFYKSGLVHRETMSIDTEERMFYTKPEEKPLDVSIKVYKEIRILELYGDDNLIGRFRIAIGAAPIGAKEKEGDKKTPEGKYYICTRNDKSKYTLFLGLSYPNVEDAKIGLEEGLISETDFEEIQSELESGKRPAWNTALGGAIGIHGGGTSSDWTFGCIAVSDDDIKIIWEYTKMNIPVEIYK